MEIQDKFYLGMQFRLRVFEKNATEFQNFFESIMEAAFPSFRKIRPYGKKGDKGNDGYRPDEGIYYQVYAPKNPNEKESEAARKLKRDFEKLKTNWDKISEIKKFYFVFNDKWGGSSIEIETALAELKADNPGIDFQPFLAKDLEDVFFTLEPDEIQSLGFDIDSRNALRLSKENLEKLEVYLDRGNASFVLESLGSLKDIILGLNDEDLFKEWEILECRSLQRLERAGEAIKKYEGLCTRYPTDPRPFLYLAEAYLNFGDYDRNAELLRKAEEINGDFWLLNLQRLLRDQRLENKVDIAHIDEEKIPTEPRIRSNFFRVYAVLALQDKDQPRAESLIERAIKLNPDRFDNHMVKLAVSLNRIISIHSGEQSVKEGFEKQLSAINAMQEEVARFKPLSARNQAILNAEKIRVYYAQENGPALELLAQETFHLLMQCYFDGTIDRILADLLMFVQPPEEEFTKLLRYLSNIEIAISDQLAKAMVFQFILRNTLFTDGKSFFEQNKKSKFARFIEGIEHRRDEDVWRFLEADLTYAVALASIAKDFPELRRTIIKNLPDDVNVQKEKLKLLLNYEESNLEEAFRILRTLDLSKLHYFESKVILEIAEKKKAWDFAIIVLEKLLLRQEPAQVALQMKLKLFEANLKLKRLRETVEIGEAILSNAEELGLLNEANKEALLAQTIQARLDRGEFPEALALVRTYPDIPKTPEFKSGLETEVYLKNQQAENAISSIVAGVRMLKAPIPEYYAKLFIYLIEIDSLTPLPLSSDPTFSPESFVKFKGEERWYYVGEGDQLDAIKIPHTDDRFAQFSGKAVGDTILFEFKYRAKPEEHVLEIILPIDKYIFWQARHCFNQLVAQGNLKGVEMIEVPKKGDTIDPVNIIARLEDERKGRSEFFDLYCNQMIPLAFLAISEGGLTSAIGLIQNEERGFVRCSSGDINEFNQQKEAAKRIIAGNPFYIDGTSALIMSEFGLLLEIHQHLPNLRVPQSVIAMLLKCKERFLYIPGQKGHLQYAKGKVRVAPASPDRGESLRKRFEDTVRLLESKPERVDLISSASKADCLSEQRVPAELCDACVLAQKHSTPVLTEDFLYLQANNIETKKGVPQYCSAIALLRVLYEQGKASFETYLKFFSYLSSYRFRFLHINIDDIQKAVFGDTHIARVQPGRIQWFNFPLTLSEAYGVPFATSFNAAAIFLLRIVVDDTVVPELAERIFAEILSAFPTDKDNRALGKLFLSFCKREIENVQKILFIGNTAQRKIEKLFQFTELYKDINSLWTPPKTQG